MQFVNDTPHVAKLYRAQLPYRDLTLATAVVKASYEVLPEGLVSAVVDPLAIVESAAQTPLGELESDVVPIKVGCDFAVYGAATSPVPVRRLDVIIRIGDDFCRQLRVSGERRWTASKNGAFTTEPEAFTEMPLDYAHAYGGQAVQDGELVGEYSDNPEGAGYIVREEHSPGMRLPNVEEVDQLIATPLQRVMPAGILPLPRRCTLRGLRGIDVDVNDQRTSLRPTVFVWSHPRMHLPEYPAGAEVRIRGMTLAPELRFSLPRLAVNARVRLGNREHVLSLVPDTLCIIPGNRRFWVVLRRALVYEFKPERLREIRLETADRAVPEGALTSIAAEFEAAQPQLRIEPPDAPERMPVPWDMLREMNPMTSIVESLPLCVSG